MGRKRKRISNVRVSHKRLSINPQEQLNVLKTLIKSLFIFEPSLVESLTVLKKGYNSKAIYTAWKACSELNATLNQIMSLDKVAGELAAPSTDDGSIDTIAMGKKGKVIWTGQSRKPGSHSG